MRSAEACSSSLSLYILHALNIPVCAFVSRCTLVAVYLIMLLPLSHTHVASFHTHRTNPGRLLLAVVVLLPSFGFDCVPRRLGIKIDAIGTTAQEWSQGQRRGACRIRLQRGKGEQDSPLSFDTSNLKHAAASSSSSAGRSSRSS
jgi:hypothetical protein